MPGEAGLIGSGIGKTKGLFKASTIPSAPHTIRTQILRALHAVGAKRRLGHEEIRAISRERFGVGSMGDLEVDQVRALYGQVVGWEFRSKHPGIRDRRRRKAAGTAGRDNGQGGRAKIVHVVRPEDVELLHQFAHGRLGWTEKALKGFIRRQLRGRQQIRTLADLNAVLWAVKRMVREREKRK